MKGRKVIAIITALAMIFATLSVSFAAEEEEQAPLVSAAADFTDVTGHWGQAAIVKWSGFGIINGYEGLFRPDDPITRGEMAVILDNMMDYQVAAQNTFGDLQAGQFYTDAVLKANAAGVINGYDGSVRPTEKITKEEAAVMFSRAFAVEEASATRALLDAAAVSDWAKGAVFGMEAKGYVSGYAGYFNPKANITRAEAVTMINNIVKAYYTAAGTYTDNVAGTAVIKAAGVIIKDAVIDGDVIVAEGVADGNVTFDGKATIKGELVVRGGGENSIVITGDANVQSVRVEKVGGKVRILADGVVIGEVEATEEVILEGTFTNVTVAADASVVIKGNVAKLDLEEKGAVDIQSGTVTTLNIQSGATANIAGSATVKTANVTGAAEIKGTGKIETAVISGTGATIAQTPTKVEVKEGGTATVGGKAVDNKTNPTTPAAPGGGGGGGGSDNGGPTVNHPDLSLTNLTYDGSAIPVIDGVYQVPQDALTTSSSQAIGVTIIGSGFDSAKDYDVTVTVTRTAPRSGEQDETVTDIPGVLMNQTYGPRTFASLPALLNYYTNTLAALTGSAPVDPFTDFLETQGTGYAYTVTFTYATTGQSGQLDGGVFKFVLVP